MGKILKGTMVEKIEARYGRDLESILLEHEEYFTPLPYLSNKLGAHLQTLYDWRKKLGFPKRKEFQKTVKNRKGN